MLPDRVSNPGPLTYESGALPIALRGPAHFVLDLIFDAKCYLRNRFLLTAIFPQYITGWMSVVNWTYNCPISNWLDVSRELDISRARIYE